jgi:hypothetical protein
MSTEVQQNEQDEVTVEQANEVIAKAIELEKLEEFSKYTEAYGSKQPMPAMLKFPCPEGPGVWIRFADEQRVVAEAILYPLYPAQIFIEQSRAMIGWRVERYNVPEEEREKIVFDNAVLMLRYLLNYIHRRVDLALGNMVYEILDVRQTELRMWDEERYMAAGIPLRYKNTDEYRTTLFNEYVTEIKKLWNMPSPGGSKPDVFATDEQLKIFAREYPALLKHWRNVAKWRKADPDGNWRAHAKVDQEDTPEDLLDRLDDLDPYTRQPSRLAHEHAARRAQILRAENCDEETINARQRGIPATGCSESQLSRLRRRGERLNKGNQDSPMSDTGNRDSQSANPANE